ncbi:uncharacterized protein LOC132700792 [Cylas formicarius]|uniref:uncharacterized protein LOC132700792 n=1 Tax=Cylas formicarius TaxID=197179 RepID=UPI0029586566|nr:uncharacterized protein LOC132700792 [Cylas formicarius]
MGCSATRGVVEPDDGRLYQNGTRDLSEAARVPRDVELLEDDVHDVHEAAHGLAYDISFDEDDDDVGERSRRPPRRLLRREEATGSPVTLEKLREKLEGAEMRRQKILQERIRSANQLYSHVRRRNDNGDVEDRETLP